MKGVYLIHFATPYKGTSHYIGYSDNVYNRFAEHAKGNGNPLIKAVIGEGTPILLVRFWQGEDRNFERKLKNRKAAHKLCPCCNKNWAKNA
jgi:predicted GIY-YIG superfamily endonuclease